MNSTHLSAEGAECNDIDTSGKKRLSATFYITVTSVSGLGAGFS